MSCAWWPCEHRGGDAEDGERTVPRLAYIEFDWRRREFNLELRPDQMLCSYIRFDTRRR